MSESLISSEVEFDLDGKHQGFLRLPYSVHRSAYGWIPVPIVVIKNGEGPTVLMMSGNHGDEYEGQIALSKLSRELAASDIRGQLIIMTMANYPAAQAGLRTSPIDAGNLNRAFPGNPLGTPTEMIAHYIEEVLMPMCDYAFDFHAGGSSLMYPIVLMRGPGFSPDETEKLMMLQRAFDAPYAWLVANGIGPKNINRTSMAAAARKGVITINAESGGGGTVTSAVLAHTDRGIKRMLHSLKMLPDYQPDAAFGTRELRVIDMIHAYESGIFEAFLEPGDVMKAGSQVGAIHHPEEPWREPGIIQSKHSGIAMCRRFQARVERGDCLYQVGIDIEE